MIWEVGGKIHWLLASIETPAYARIFVPSSWEKETMLLVGVTCLSLHSLTHWQQMILWPCLFVSLSQDKIIVLMLVKLHYSTGGLGSRNTKLINNCQVQCPLTILELRKFGCTTAVLIIPWSWQGCRKDLCPLDKIISNSLFSCQLNSAWVK